MMVGMRVTVQSQPGSKAWATSMPLLPCTESSCLLLARALVPPYSSVDPQRLAQSLTTPTCWCVVFPTNPHQVQSSGETLSQPPPTQYTTSSSVSPMAR